MEKIQTVTQRSGACRQERLGKRQILKKGFIGFFRYIFQVALGAALTILLILGLCDVHEQFYPDDVPQIRTGTSTFEPFLNVDRNTASVEAKNMCSDQCWESLQSPLLMLDVICPEVSQWVRETHNKGKIEWVNTGYENFYARYNILHGRVQISNHLFRENDGRKAAILAHEFRHSRQSGVKSFKSMIFYLLGSDNCQVITENDACIFESKVYLAILRQ